MGGMMTGKAHVHTFISGSGYKVIKREQTLHFALVSSLPTILKTENKMVSDPHEEYA